MFIGGGPIRWLIKKGVEVIADRLFQSPLDKDFGEATAEDIIPPDARCVATMQLDDLEEPLARLAQMIEGLTIEHVSKVSLRLYELRIGRTANYQFQVKDEGRPMELQFVLSKYANREVEIDFRSSQNVINIVQRAIAGE